MAIFKRIIRFCVKGFILVFILINVFILVTGNFYLYRGIYYTALHGQKGPGIFDKDYFYSRELPTTKAEPWKTTTLYGKKDISADAKQKLTALATTSFLVIQNDSLVFEEYFDGFGQKEVSNSFSMAKSVISLLIGIAVDEGKIKSIDDHVSLYLDGYRDGNRKNITIRQLLSMSSDMQWDESAWNPLSDNAEAYYGTELTTLMENVNYGAYAGKTFDYKSGNTQILGMILTKVTGKSIAAYATEKLWSKIGAEQTAYWSLDHENGIEKAYCCLYATTRDFARLGKLMLQNGKWGGKTVVDSAYVQESISPAKLNTTDGKTNNRYGLSWWLLNYKGHSIFYARGILGQYVICIPEKNTIVVRTGHKRGKKRSDDQPEDLFLYIDLALGLTH